MTRTHAPHASDCPHCRASDCVRSPNPLWRVAVLGAWLVTAGTVAVASVIGPFILLVGPLITASGAGLLAFVHDKAGALPECQACGKIVLQRAASQASTRARGAALAASVRA